MDKVLIIVGPTASGKTKLGIEAAKRFNGEIISADSMQIYKYMNIGTAKPNSDEQEGVPHHLIDIMEPNEKFSVAEFKERAEKCIEDILGRGKLPIIVGGTGLYVNALINTFDFMNTNENPEFRQKLEEEAKQFGNEVLYEKLKKIDPEVCNRIHLNDLKRIIRALEIYEVTGKNITENQKNTKEISKKYDYIIVGLNTDREKLYERINLRVDIMLKEGLLDEVRAIQSRLKDAGKTTSLQAIGYKEIIDFYDGKISLDEAIEKVKKESRNYAKRQLTWFRRNQDIVWLEVIDSIENKLEIIENLLKEEK